MRDTMRDTMKTLDELLVTLPENLTKLDKMFLKFNDYFGYNYRQKHPNYKERS